LASSDQGGCYQMNPWTGANPSERSIHLNSALVWMLLEMQMGGKPYQQGETTATWTS